MKEQEIKNWALGVVSSALAGNPAEDNRVECKSSWLDAKQIARQIAGHANAAHGQDILWLIGVDEKAGAVRGAESNELANWYPQLKKEFDGGFAPGLLANVNIFIGGVSVVALLFGTGDAPYMVKVPNTDRLEIPWREGTRTRSATRSELLKIFSLLQTRGQLVPIKDLAEETPRAQFLALEKPRFWEYLLTIELLKSKLVRVRRNYNDVERGLAFRKSRIMSAPEFSNFVLAKMSDIELLVPAFTVAVEEEIPASWGAPGETGDVLEIKRAVDRLMAACNELVEWEGDLVSVRPPEIFDGVATLMRGLTAQMLSEMEHFANELSKPFEQPNPAGEYEINLKFTFPQDRINQITEETGRIRDRIASNPELWS
ncbi:MAG: hypothetical protein ABW007_27305 [Chitinophagaceae bacterium]